MSLDGRDAYERCHQPGASSATTRTSQHLAGQSRWPRRERHAHRLLRGGPVRLSRGDGPRATGPRPNCYPTSSSTSNPPRTTPSPPSISRDRGDGSDGPAPREPEFVDADLASVHRRADAAWPHAEIDGPLLFGIRCFQRHAWARPCRRRRVDRRLRLPAAAATSGLRLDGRVRAVRPRRSGVPVGVGTIALMSAPRGTNERPAGERGAP